MTITPQFSGIFTAFGVSHICGQDMPASSKWFGPFPIDATGKFEVTVTVPYGCQPECSVGLFVTCNNLLPSKITHPGTVCRCG